jgi:hypothetical protein
LTKVYVPNRGPHNYSDAERFGEIVFCTDGSLDKMDTAQMYRELVDAMYDSETEDFILLGSLTSLCCVACSIFTAKHWRLNLLIHSQGGYVDRSLYLNNIR